MKLKLGVALAALSSIALAQELPKLLPDDLFRRNIGTRAGM